MNTFMKTFLFSRVLILLSVSILSVGAETRLNPHGTESVMCCWRVDTSLRCAVDTVLSCDCKKCRQHI